MGEDLNPGSNDAATEPSAVERKIIQQIEYYFGDFNLVRDKFLQEQIKVEDGWIPLETMVKFNRLKTLSTDFEVIATALKKSSNQLIEISEDGQKIRRTPLKPLPESIGDREDLISRTIYIKRFQHRTTLDELLEFFKDKGNVSNICMMKKYNKKDFKGSIYVTFASKDDAENFMKLDNVKFSGCLDLHRERKQDYLNRKQKDYERRKAEKEKRKQETQKDTDEVEMNTEKKEQDILKGCLLKLTGLSEVTKWEDIKAALSPYEEIAYVDYSKGKPQAIVRFTAKNGASSALEKALKASEGNENSDSTQTTITICDKEVAAIVIEGEEEVEYWNKISVYKNKKRMNKNHKKGKKQGRGKHFRSNKRQNGKEDSEDMEEDASSKKRGAEDIIDPPTKHTKIDSDSD